MTASEQNRISDISAYVHVTRNLRSWSTEEWNVILEIECPKTVQNRLHVVDDPASRLEDGGNGVVLLPYGNKFARQKQCFILLKNMTWSWLET